MAAAKSAGNTMAGAAGETGPASAGHPAARAALLGLRAGASACAVDFGPAGGSAGGIGCCFHSCRRADARRDDAAVPLDERDGCHQAEPQRSAGTACQLGRWLCAGRGGAGAGAVRAGRGRMDGSIGYPCPGRWGCAPLAEDEGRRTIAEIIKDEKTLSGHCSRARTEKVFLAGAAYSMPVTL